MKSLRGKILFIILFSVLCIGGIGYYSVTNLFELNNQVQRISKPNEKWQLFRKITGNLHTLNYLYYSQALNTNETFEEDHFSLIDSISTDIAELRAVYSAEINKDHIASLDTIPVLLEQIKTEFQELKDLQNVKQYKVVENLEEELLLNLDGFSTKDSMYIIDRIYMEVRRRNIPDSVFFHKEKEQGQKRNFFQRLFSKSKPPEEPAKEVQLYKEVTDTIVNTITDIVVVETPLRLSSEDSLSKVIKKAFTNYYDNEIELLGQIRENEIKLYQRSAKITSDLEQLVNELRFVENQQSSRQAELTFEYSENFKNIILLTLFFFGLFSLISVYMVIRDIEKNRKYQLQILENENIAKREAMAKQEFLTTMSHELRTPLTSIIGYAELLDQSDPKVKSIRSSSVHLLNVANEILDGTKIEFGVIEIKEQTFDLTELFTQIRDNTIQIISDAGLEPRFVLPEKLCYVKSDSYRIQQIVYNLIHNAVKFTRDGYISMEVRIIEDNKRCQVEVDISDSGIGIHESNLDTIFENYQQIGTSKNTMQGIGLGLGLVKKIVKQIGGEISVKSKIGKGSVFQLSLSLQRSEKPDTASQSIVPDKDFLKDKHIYCIDDDPLITKLYQMILTQYGAQVSIENNPTTALYHLREFVNNYDLVITDVKMPDLTGYELLNKLKNINARPDKIIASTANVLLNQKDKEDLAGFDAYISKPILQADLLKTVATVLGVKWNDIIDESVPVAVKSDFYIDDLQSFTMGDEDLLKEVLTELYKGNSEYIQQAVSYLKKRDNIKLSELIHKLSSRFAQIKVKEIVPVKKLEIELLTDKKMFTEAEKLLVYWSEVNHNFETFVKEKF